MGGRYQSYFPARFICKPHFPPLKSHSHRRIQKETPVLHTHLIRSTSQKLRLLTRTKQRLKHLRLFSKTFWTTIRSFYTVPKLASSEFTDINLWSSYFTSVIPACRKSAIRLFSVFAPLSVVARIMLIVVSRAQERCPPLLQSQCH